jgi:hypothetical protein
VWSGHIRGHCSYVKEGALDMLSPRPPGKHLLLNPRGESFTHLPAHRSQIMVRELFDGLEGHAALYNSGSHRCVVRNNAFMVPERKVIPNEPGVVNARLDSGRG